MLPELHAEAWMEMFDPGLKISLEVGLTSDTLGASSFEDDDPGTTVHGAAPVVPVEVGDALAVDVVGLEEAVLVPVAVEVAVAVELAVAVLLALAVGLADAVPPVLLLHATPFSVNAVGVSSDPLRLNVAPMPVEAFVARLPFQLSLATLIVPPLCVHVPSQPLASVSDPVYAYCRFQLVIAGPVLVMVICTSNPVVQFELTV
nr:hypothetical protein [Actinospica acidithermotolerans]